MILYSYYYYFRYYYIFIISGKPDTDFAANQANPMGVYQISGQAIFATNRKLFFTLNKLIIFVLRNRQL